MLIKINSISKFSESILSSQKEYHYEVNGLHPLAILFLTEHYLLVRDVTKTERTLLLVVRHKNVRFGLFEIEPLSPVREEIFRVRKLSSVYHYWGRWRLSTTGQNYRAATESPSRTLAMFLILCKFWMAGRYLLTLFTLNLTNSAWGNTLRQGLEQTKAPSPIPGLTRVWRVLSLPKRLLG